MLRKNSGPMHWAATLLLGVTVMMLALREPSSQAAAPKHESLLWLKALDKKWHTVLLLGHNGLLTDLQGISLIQLLATPEVVAPLSGEDTATLSMSYLAGRPPMETPYLLTCQILIEKDRADLCERVHLHGMESMPWSWRLPTQMAITAILKLRDPIKAGFYLEAAVKHSSAPPFLAGAYEKLRLQSSLSLEAWTEEMEKIRRQSQRRPSADH